MGNDFQSVQKGAQYQQKRVLPQSELDLAMLTTESVWGRPEISQELITRLNREYTTRDEDGKEGTQVISSWGLLSFYTRDIRLSNLSELNGELEYVKYFLDLSGDMLQADMHPSFLVALSRVASVTETSQGKKGFLRKLMATFRQEHITQELEPPKKSLFGMKKKEGPQ